ncbi:MAG: hypothetical protein ACTSV3_00435 [Candidatus Thorarchaeota archaeon]|nr:MAG: hypothetical protein DRO87_07805 [Candidatus Thorarchaeota archaeon]RLI57750.1 MAG: hypothetical protein DRP09_01550 [Candidatus Thorarchaeota archaeon]
MVEQSALEAIVGRLVDAAYPELASSKMEIAWTSIRAFATVTWSQDRGSVQLYCSRETESWHEAALTGLLAHELSHPAQNGSSSSEESTDRDAIRRGLGVYLAVGRLYAGKYEDHVLRGEKDRYLGYRSIRETLRWQELAHLDRLLGELGLIPSREKERRVDRTYDISAQTTEFGLQLRIDGQQFTIHGANSVDDLKFVQDGQTMVIYFKGARVGSLPT